MEQVGCTSCQPTNSIKAQSRQQLSTTHLALLAGVTVARGVGGS